MILVIKDFVNIMLAIFIYASRAPVNNSEKHINWRENMGIDEMQETYGNITHDHFYQHKRRAQDVLVHHQTIDFRISVHCWPVSNGDHHRSDACNVEEQP